MVIERSQDDALELAVMMVGIIQAERDEVGKKLQEKFVGCLNRSPAYWAVYRFVKDYISTYHISLAEPVTNLQTVRACLKEGRFLSM